MVTDNRLYHPVREILEVDNKYLPQQFQDSFTDQSNPVWLPITTVRLL